MSPYSTELTDSITTQLPVMLSWQNQAQLSQFGWGGVSTQHRSVPSSLSLVNLVPSDTCGSVRRPRLGGENVVNVPQSSMNPSEEYRSLDINGNKPSQKK